MNYIPCECLILINLLWCNSHHSPCNIYIYIKIVKVVLLHLIVCCLVAEFILPVSWAYITLIHMLLLTDYCHISQSHSATSITTLTSQLICDNSNSNEYAITNEITCPWACHICHKSSKQNDFFYKYKCNKKVLRQKADLSLNALCYSGWLQ